MPGAPGTRAIRIAVVIPSHWDYRIGGSQYQAKLLIEQLYTRYGAEIAYLTARASEKREFPDHRVVCVGKSNSLRHFGHFWDYFRLQRALEGFAPDIIYQRVGCAYTGIAATYARRAGVPMVWHLASQKDARRAPPISQLLSRPHAILESRLRHRGAALADVIVAQSEDQARDLQRDFGRQADRLIRNFHEVPPATEKPAGRFTVVWIGNLKPIKRPELLLEIASHLRDRPDIEFLVIGSAYSSKSLQSRLDDLLRELPNVRFLGALPQEEVNSLLDGSDLLVNTSRSEGFSNTFIQAWMRSVPVLTMGVNPDGLLSDSYLGRSCDSTIDVAGAIRELASNSDMLAEMGKRSRKYAVQHFSMDNAAALADLIVGTARGKLGAAERTPGD